MLRLNLHILIIVLACFFIACSGNKNFQRQNYSYLYKPVKELNPEYSVFHLSANTSRLYFRIPVNDIEFKKNSVDEEAIARIRLNAKLYSTFDNQTVIDTVSGVFTKSLNDVATINTRNYILDSIDIRVQMGANYMFQIMFTDLNQSKFFNYSINIEKTSINNRQQFRITDENNFIHFGYIVNKYDLINIEHFKNPLQLFVRYYKRDFPLAAPAFVTTNYQPFNYTADSTFLILNTNNIFQFIPSKEGFYHIQVDSLHDKEGLTFFVFGNNFPHVSSPENLLEPLRYITSKEEYENIKMAENIKMHVEKFWLNAAGSTDRARELIKKYYGRVYQANLLFSSYKEGWKTDRGLIYIIFGIPNVVHRTSSSEIWIYGEENNMMSLSFTFYKVINPFTDNDYILDRSVIYKNNWYRGVESWRQGRIY
ncbi:MAG: GWxTD domain-containing protein [Bacteroidia bacterium]